MTKSSYYAVLIGISVFLPSIHDVFAQAVAACATLETMPVGEWSISSTDALNGSLAISQDSRGFILGTWNGGLGGGCGGLQFSVSGTYQGSGDFVLHATPVAAPTTCPTLYNIHGTISGVGCDTAAVSWTADLGSRTGLWGGQNSFTHACYAPTTETRPVPVGWGQVGNDKTIATFRQSIVPSTYNWGGRTIFETSPVAGTDTCYNEAIDAPNNVPKGDRVTGGSKTFTSGSSYGDDIGVTEALVTYYRTRNRIPCGYQVRQALWISCDPGQSGQSTGKNYLTYTDSFGFGSTDVTAVRGGVGTTNFWLSPTTVASTKVITKLLLKTRH